MRLQNISAKAHPEGNRIDLSWDIPELSEYPGVRVVRREGTHPQNPDDGVEVAHGLNIQSASDSGLQAETVYYYALFPFRNEPPEYFYHRHNRASTLATGPYAFAQFIHSLLPAIYHRYDTDLPEPDAVAPGERNKGQLRRFLDLPGGQLDQLHSFAKAALDLHNLKKVEGSLLPLLAQWIGWKTDYNLEVETQRNEIRHAPAVYHAIGLIPTVEATVKRISNWESRSKEFIHNVGRSNQPERLNWWGRGRNSLGVWDESADLFSLDFAYEGRASSTQDSLGIRWLVYHTQRKNRWQIWFKSSPVSYLSTMYTSYLVAGAIDVALRQGLVALGLSVSEDAVLTQAGHAWRIDDATLNEHYVIEIDSDKLMVYHTSAPIDAWSPSQPLIVGDTINKYPSLVAHEGVLRLFWSEYDETTARWRIRFCQRSNGHWSGVDQPGDSTPFMQGGAYDGNSERRDAVAAVDHDGDLWLFWRQRVAKQWQLFYNRLSAGVWGADAQRFPLDGGVDARVEGEPIVLMRTEGSGPMIYLFWGRQISASEPSQRHWQIAYRSKQNLNFDTANWSAVHVLNKTVGDTVYHDREPYVSFNNDGDIELFYASNRHGPWSVWHIVLTNTGVDANPNLATHLNSGPYSQRAPWLLSGQNGEALLIYRSNQSLRYTSPVYGATETLDHRYAGATSWHQRNSQKIALYGEFGDFQTYTYDTGDNGKRDDRHWYGRDTLGIYIEPDSIDQGVVAATIERLRPIVKEFMPVTDRAVFISASDTHTERVYSYGLPQSGSVNYITSTYADALSVPVTETVLPPGEDFSDRLT